MTEILIDIQHKTYKATQGGAEHRAIENFKLSLATNEFVCLFGRSGCGKTSLLNCISGLDEDFAGKIELGKQHERPKIGYIFQTPRLLPWRTVRENIDLALDPLGATENVDALLELMQLADKQHLYPKQLSGGMSRRVSIIRGFAINPDILLMDEPFVSLGAPTARQVREMLIQLWQKRPHTVLFVTHDLREAIALADRLIFLSQPPMQVLSEIPVTIARNERNDERLIEDFRQQMITEHPEIQPLL